MRRVGTDIQSSVFHIAQGLDLKKSNTGFHSKQFKKSLFWYKMHSQWKYTPTFACCVLFNPKSHSTIRFPGANSSTEDIISKTGLKNHS